MFVIQFKPLECLGWGAVEMSGKINLPNFKVLILPFVVRSWHDYSFDPVSGSSQQTWARFFGRLLILLCWCAGGLFGGISQNLGVLRQLWRLGFSGWNSFNGFGLFNLGVNCDGRCTARYVGVSLAPISLLPITREAIKTVHYLETLQVLLTSVVETLLEASGGAMMVHLSTFLDQNL